LEKQHKVTINFRRRPTHLRIDLDALEKNLMVVRSHVADTQIMAVLKADAYGHGLLVSAKKFADLGVDFFGVAFPEEGIQLRQAGIEAPILVLGGLVGYQVKHFLDYHLDITASSIQKAQQISSEAQRMGRTARVHLKIDTGMNRIGVRAENAVEFALDVARLPRLEIVGIFSHFVGDPGTGLNLGRSQQELFRRLVEETEANGLQVPLVHMANSFALFNLEDVFGDMVRPGLTLFGYPPGGKRRSDWPLTPALSAHTEIVFMKGIREGSGVGYMHSWKAPRDGWLATLPVGYGDGYPRILSNRSNVLINQNPYPVVGNISMDQMMVWLGDDNYDVGEDVVLVGRQGSEQIGAWELARKAETLAYEILCGWTPRVPRVYEGSGWKPQ
jgi:alanine racemase